MKYLKGVLVGFGAAGLASLFYLVFYSKKIQIWERLFAGVITIEQPLIDPFLVFLMIVAFALGFFFTTRSQRASN